MKYLVTTKVIDVLTPEKLDELRAILESKILVIDIDENGEFVISKPNEQEETK